MKILITGGGCEEPVDDVRSLCNFSTGNTARRIAEYIMSGFPGCEVTAVMAFRAQKPDCCRVVTFRTFSQLYDIMQKECTDGAYDAVIHAAAVSDFSPEYVVIDGKEYTVGSVPKISSAASLSIKMRKNPKIVARIKEWTGRKCFLAAFKLTSGANEISQAAAVEKLFEECGKNGPENCPDAPDVVVANELSLIKDGVHPCRIYGRDGLISVTATVEELSRKLMEAIYDYGD